jgi:predicted Rdx family selenoprotein
MTPDEKQEVLHLLEAHERTLAICRVCAQTARDLAWEIKRGGTPDAAALKQTIDESERVLAELGHLEIAIAEMKAALW